MSFRPCQSPERRWVAAELSLTAEMDRPRRGRLPPRIAAPASQKRREQTRPLPAFLLENRAGYFRLRARLRKCFLCEPWRPHLHLKSPANPGASSYRQIGYLQACLGHLPRTERAAQIHELAKVVGVVVREKQRFAQNRLALTMRYFGEQIGARVSHQTDHLFQIALERRHAFLPGYLIGGHRRFWAVSVWKIRRDVFWISAEVHDVPLREPRVFEQLPARVRKRVRECPIFLSREIVQSVHEMDVRASAF